MALTLTSLLPGGDHKLERTLMVIFLHLVDLANHM